MKKVFFVFALFFIIFSVSLSAQNAGVIADIVARDKSVWSDLTYLAYYMDETNASSGENLNPEDTFDIFNRNGLIPSGVTKNSLLRYDEMAHFMYNAFSGIKRSSLMYTMFNSRHYAFRQLKTDGLVLDSAFPTDKLSGFRLVTFAGDFYNKYDEKVFSLKNLHN